MGQSGVIAIISSPCTPRQSRAAVMQLSSIQEVFQSSVLQNLRSLVLKICHLPLEPGLGEPWITILAPQQRRITSCAGDICKVASPSSPPLQGIGFTVPF
ncbi:hypothetical protein F7725_000047 [Dissostichus mawsoni]|uniref:Uncharacterized protein n=1 Tax=Dissostichus mawsoni TaxID=36200 RepID=A0A7J5ZD84_DISMA|nr:hypothetical protein F7725_000047 [Dissostichus mawsoni]